MYENFFEMRNTPFVRNVPADRLYRSPQIEDAIGRLRVHSGSQEIRYSDGGAGLRQVHVDQDVRERTSERQIPAFVSVGFEADAAMAVFRAAEPAWTGAEILQRRFQERSEQRAGNDLGGTGPESGLHT